MEDKKQFEFKFDGTKLKPYLTKSIAEHAKEFGVSRVHLSEIVSGRKTPSIDLATTICMKLNAPIEELAISA